MWSTQSTKKNLKHIYSNKLAVLYGFTCYLWLTIWSPAHWLELLSWNSEWLLGYVGLRKYSVYRLLILFKKKKTSLCSIDRARNSISYFYMLHVPSIATMKLLALSRYCIVKVAWITELYYQDKCCVKMTLKSKVHFKSLGVRGHTRSSALKFLEGLTSIFCS